jgi:hypothetical protein
LSLGFQENGFKYGKEYIYVNIFSKPMFHAIWAAIYYRIHERPNKTGRAELSIYMEVLYLRNIGSNFNCFAFNANCIHIA